MNYFIIPGNPPAVHFYELWGQEILASYPDAQVRVSPYPKLDKNLDSEKYMLDVLKAHTEQLINFYDKIKSPITIIGHSLGGNFALQILNADKMDIVGKAILLHPFLRSPGRSGQMILKAAAFIQGKDSFQDIIIKNRRLFELLSDDLLHVTNEELEKTFYLAKHESIIILPDRSPVLINNDKRNKVLVFHSMRDTWCLDEVIADLRKQVKIHECTEPHGFVTSKDHRRSLFDKIVLSKS